jgi:hypothetical protein
MWFAFGIEQDVPRFDVAMKNAVLVRVVNCSRHLDNQFDGATQRHRFTSDDCVKLAAFDEFHAEVAGAIALADLVDRNDSRMLQLRCRFGFTTKTLQMRFGGPMAQADHFEGNGTVETFLLRPVHYALTTTTDYFQQFIVAEIGERRCSPRASLTIRRSLIIMAAGVVDPGRSFTS